MNTILAPIALTSKDKKSGQPLPFVWDIDCELYYWNTHYHDMFFYYCGSAQISLSPNPNTHILCDRCIAKIVVPLICCNNTSLNIIASVMFFIELQ